MQVVALDIGEKRIGIACANTATGIASPVCVMPAQEVIDNAATWQRILQDHEPELLVCGMPVSMSGAKGKQAARVEDMAHQISSAAGLPMEFIDERLSSSEAKQYLRELGMSERDMRGKVDSVAASLILDTWLKQRQR